MIAEHLADDAYGPNFNGGPTRSVTCTCACTYYGELHHPYGVDMGEQTSHLGSHRVLALPNARADS